MSTCTTNTSTSDQPAEKDDHSSWMKSSYAASAEYAVKLAIFRKGFKIDMDGFVKVGEGFL
jgi:hypothetical protein